MNYPYQKDEQQLAERPGTMRKRGKYRSGYPESGRLYARCTGRGMEEVERGSWRERCLQW